MRRRTPVAGFVEVTGFALATAAALTVSLAATVGALTGLAGRYWRLREPAIG